MINFKNLLVQGSAAKEMMTIAEYDEITNEFIMHTPSEFAMKWWIGAAGQLASISLIWAQLYVKGVNKGLHGFLVPIRDRKTHNVLPGVTCISKFQHFNKFFSGRLRSKVGK